jgi:predicted RND superfamily exporter protein
VTVGDGLTERYAAFLAARYRLVAVLVLVLSGAVAAGVVVGESEDGEIGQFQTDSPERAALDEIERDYPSDDAVVAQVVVRDGNVLSRESLLASLRLQRAMRGNDSVNATLREDRGVAGLENVVATAAYREDRAAEGDGPPADGSAERGDAAGDERSRPPLDEQIDALEARDEAEVAALVERVLDPERETPGPDPYQFLSTDYEPGGASADARVTFVFQTDDGGPDEDPQAAYDAQLTVERMVEERFDDAFVFGQGVTDDASSRAVGDSFAIITPVALVLVLTVLGVAYRDAVDVLVGVFGIAVVMAWLAGLQGWLGIPSSQLLIAVPFLLIGLSIDYSLHVVMRYREARESAPTGADPAAGADGGRPSPAAAMRAGITGVIFALAAATVSTGVGFLSNYVSPLAAIRDFAVLSAGGIFAALVVFGALVPAVKIGVETLFDRFGFDRRKPAVGIEAGPINRALSGAASLADRAPVGVVLVALLLASTGAYGATGIDTEFNRADFLPEDAPDWATSLPGPLAAGDYEVRDNAAFLGDNFRQRGQGTEAQVLLRGDVTDPATLRALDAATRDPDRDGAVVVRADGAAAVDGPHSLVRDVAAENETIAAAVEERDADGDGLPDEDIAAVYDLLYDAAPDRAAAVLARTDDGEYASARLVVGVQADASAQTVAGDVRAFADRVAADAPVTAVATGGPVTTAVLQDALLETLVQAFAVTLAVIGVFLTALYARRYGAPEFGVVTLAPVVIALAWLLGTMSVLGIPFNSETAVITSLAIGLGVDYSIHLGERFIDERERFDDLGAALTAALTGTGGALLGSAATTAAGFGVLTLALAPPLRRFGTVTGLSIIYAFVACVTVLPCLFVLRERVRARLA